MARDMDEPDWTRSTASGTPKPAWASMPEEVRRRIEGVIGTVVSAETQHGGFSPSVAAILNNDRGERVFVKAANATDQPFAARLHRRESRVLADLVDLPESPDLIDGFDEGTWTVLLLEAVDGRHPRLPWEENELDEVLAALERMHDRLTPSPFKAPPVAHRLAATMKGWEQLAAAGEERGLDGTGLDLDRLVAMEAGWIAASRGTTLLHLDLRADQLLLTDGGLRVLDWPYAAVGAAWLDPLGMFASVELQGGPTFEELVARCPATAAAPPKDLLTMGVAMAGYFVHNATLPPPPGLPTVRSFQRAQGRIMLAWLSRQGL